MKDYDFLTVNEAAEILNVSRCCAYDMIRQMPEAKRVGVKGVYKVERRYVEGLKAQIEAEQEGHDRVTADKYCVRDVMRMFFVSKAKAFKTMKECGGVVIKGRLWADKERVKARFGGKQNG